HVTGQTDYLLWVAARDAHDLREFVVEHLASDPAVAHAETSLIYEQRRGPGVFGADPAEPAALGAARLCARAVAPPAAAPRPARAAPRGRGSPRGAWRSAQPGNEGGCPRSGRVSRTPCFARERTASDSFRFPDAIRGGSGRWPELVKVVAGFRQQ